ncbi:zinc-ribbon domain-containing protein [Streptomyces sp. EAS-AB2608]
MARHPRGAGGTGRVNCPRCSAPVPPNAGFCKGCGAPIGQ